MMIPDVRKDTLLPIIRQKVVSDSMVYTDSYPAYDVLDASEFHHHRIDHSDAYVLDRHNHINGIESFWNRAKRTLSRYNGIPKAHFPLFLKETECNYENPASNCESSNAGPNSSLNRPIWDSP
jgi:transposase